MRRELEEFGLVHVLPDRLDEGADVGLVRQLLGLLFEIRDTSEHAHGGNEQGWVGSFPSDLEQRVAEVRSLEAGEEDLLVPGHVQQGAEGVLQLVHGEVVPLHSPWSEDLDEGVEGLSVGPEVEPRRAVEVGQPGVEAQNGRVERVVRHVRVEEDVRDHVEPAPVDEELEVVPQANEPDQVSEHLRVGILEVDVLQDVVHLLLRDVAALQLPRFRLRLLQELLLALQPKRFGLRLFLRMSRDPLQDAQRALGQELVLSRVPLRDPSKEPSRGGAGLEEVADRVPLQRDLLEEEHLFSHDFGHVEEFPHRLRGRLDEVGLGVADEQIGLLVRQP
mmetsp:Transcript_8100/g.19839  ORF Transcript_8100/g.19839 Transcript_8100/m.19839 type:complete len:333 (-) Transcript_8100:3120-4118(-)